MAATIWYRKDQNKREINRIAKHRKVDIAAAILRHDGVEVTADEINRLMSYRKSGLCSIFHDDHYGKRIRVNKKFAHGGRYVKESEVTRSINVGTFKQIGFDLVDSLLKGTAIITFALGIITVITWVM